jgi:uncharacterized protein involved in response to NO
MPPIPRYRPQTGPAIFSAGFRPFFLAAAAWSALAVPLWLAAYLTSIDVPTLLSPAAWHAHEMVYGFAAATVAGFLLTAIPNWTGRMPLQGWPLAALVLLWAAGRVAVLFSSAIGAVVATALDLAFPAAFLAVVAREIVAGRNWRNLPMLGALSLLLVGNLLVHLEVLGVSEAADLGNRLGIATLLALISLVGGRIVPSFTRNWLAKAKPGMGAPAGEGGLDRVALIVTALALLLWAFAPDAAITASALLVAGIAVGVRLARWRGWWTRQEPLLLILHAGYGWLAVGLLLLGLNGFVGALPATAALHALTAGAIGTMTLAVMTRATLGHTGRPLSAGLATRLIYILVTLAALLRVLSPFAGNSLGLILWLAGAAWTGAFGLFVLFYGAALIRPRAEARTVKPI